MISFPDEFFSILTRAAVDADPRTAGEIKGEMPPSLLPNKVPRPKPIVSLLAPLRPQPPASPYAEPRIYGLRQAVEGDLSAGSLLKVSHGGKWRHIVFHGPVSAVLWLNPRYCRIWPEFIEIERLREHQLADLDNPIFPEEIKFSEEIQP